MKEKPSKINILFVIMYVQMGGIEKLVYSLSQGLNRDVFSPSIAWFVGEEICQEFVDLKIPLFYVPKERRLDFKTMRQLENIIKENNIHIVNVHGFMNMIYSLYGTKFKNNKKLVYTLHTDWELRNLKLKSRIIGSLSTKYIDALVCVNQNFLGSWVKTFKVKPKKIVAIPNGVKISSCLEEHKIKNLRKKIGIMDDDLIIGCVANFKKIKNHIMLLQAFEKVVKYNCCVKLMLIGQGFKNDPENTENDIKKFINDKGLENNILLLGYQPDINPFLDIVDIFCLTSTQEGLPLCLIEAMAFGKPLVGTNVEGIRDVIVHNTNGYLIDLNDINGLSRAIQDLLNSKTIRNDFGLIAKEIAERNFSLSSCIKRYENLFLSLVNTKP